MARNWSKATSNAAIMKCLLLVCSLISLSAAGVLPNDFTVVATCDNSTMRLDLNFTLSFEGSVFVHSHYYNPSCSFTVSPNSNASELTLYFPFDDCEMSAAALPGGRSNISILLRVQMHNLIDSSYDAEERVWCEAPGVHGTYARNNQRYDNSNSTLDIKMGAHLFGEIGEPLESTLFVVVFVRDGGYNKDMVVSNCMAHDTDPLNETTLMYQLSNVYGCPNPLEILPEFVVNNQSTPRFNMMAYAPVSNLSLLVREGLYITCGVTLCEIECPAHCNGSESTPLFLSDIATKRIGGRGSGSRIPDTLQQLNRRARRVQKRSLSNSKEFYEPIPFIVTKSPERTVVEDVEIVQVGMDSNASYYVIGNSSYYGVSGVFQTAPTTDLTSTNLVTLHKIVADDSTFYFLVFVGMITILSVVACFCCKLSNFIGTHQSVGYAFVL